MKTIKKTVLMLLILVVSVSCGILEDTSFDLQDMVGGNISGAKRELQDKGYYHIRTDRTGYDDIYSYWWSNEKNKCVSYHSVDGRVKSVANTLASNCNKSTYGEGNNNNYYNKYNTREHHYPNQKHYGQESHNFAFDRGFQDGLHHKTYHNFYSGELKGIYANAYGKGAAERNHKTSYHSGHSGYRSHIQVYDLKGHAYESAYRTLKSRGFSENKKSMKNGKEYILWYNRSANQCVRTTRGYNHIEAIETSNYCNK